MYFAGNFKSKMGIQLQAEKDVLWIYEKLLVGADEEAASQHLRTTLDMCLKTVGTRLNDTAHIISGLYYKNFAICSQF